MDDRRLDGAVRALAAAPQLLVALDFDGVLAPIVDVPVGRPPAARRGRRRSGRWRRCPDTTVALVSGRGLADLAAVSGFGPRCG